MQQVQCDSGVYGQLAKSIALVAESDGIKMIIRQICVELMELERIANLSNCFNRMPAVYGKWLRWRTICASERIERGRISCGDPIPFRKYYMKREHRLGHAFEFILYFFIDHANVIDAQSETFLIYLSHQSNRFSAFFVP